MAFRRHFIADPRAEIKQQSGKETNLEPRPYSGPIDDPESGVYDGYKEGTNDIPEGVGCIEKLRS
jgi:hypothetical protein